LEADDGTRQGKEEEHHGDATPYAGDRFAGTKTAQQVGSTERPEENPARDDDAVRR
jgi:hypothetical protein